MNKVDTCAGLKARVTQFAKSGFKLVVIFNLKRLFLHQLHPF